MRYYLTEVEEVIKEKGGSANGLSEEQAVERREKYGANKLAESRKTPLFVRFLKQLADPMILILLAAALISGITAVMQNESFADVIIILAVVILNAVLGVIQESKAEKAIESLKEMTAATCKVMRDGKRKVLRSEELVPGDLILLEAGDSVPADGRIIECASMKIEEAALTGESVPVSKTADKLVSSGDKDIPLGDRKNMVYTGSTVVYGRGAAIVTDIGMKTEMGKIAEALTKTKEEATPLQKKLAQVSKVLTVAVLIICIIVFGVQLIRDGLNGGITTDTLLSTLLIAVSLAVAAIPEGLATVVTIVLSIGVTKMSKRNAVIRKLTAVETLGCTQVICSDKTGTLTQNKMTVVEYYGEDEMLLARACALCSDAEVNENGEISGEPTEAALVGYALKKGINKREIASEYKRVGEAPFDSMRKMMSTVHIDGDGYVQYTKGAPDELLKKCKYLIKDGKEVALTDEMRREILGANKTMADKALRVLAAAYKKYKNKPESNEAGWLEKDMVFIGLTGMIDPVRPEVKAAIEECKNAGIRTVMITGDHLDTAVAIALELGIISDRSEAVTGSTLDEISDGQLPEFIKHISVYARVQPEHKVRIVNAWKELGKITAMTGDGVNDAPSIKSANIGIGMGITGTDVTKNVADMVLADDNFATIVSAVEEGRRIYDNIRKTIQFLLSSNLSEVITIFVATIIGFTVLRPVHLLWINLITDSVPAIALGMEGAEDDIMKRPPRDSNAGIFADHMAVNVVIQGIIVSAITIGAYFIGHFMEEQAAGQVLPGLDTEHGITMAFLAMSMAEIFHSFNMRSQTKSVFGMKKQNKILWGAMLLSLILTTCVIEVPFLAEAFGFTQIGIAEYAIAIGLALTIIPLVEISKLIQRKYAAKKH